MGDRMSASRHHARRANLHHAREQAFLQRAGRLQKAYRTNNAQAPATNAGRHVLRARLSGELVRRESSPRSPAARSLPAAVRRSSVGSSSSSSSSSSSPGTSGTAPAGEKSWYESPFKEQQQKSPPPPPPPEQDQEQDSQQEQSQEEVQERQREQGRGTGQGQQPPRESATRLEIEKLYGKHSPAKLVEVPQLVEQYGEKRLLGIIQNQFRHNIEIWPPASGTDTDRGGASRNEVEPSGGGMTASLRDLASALAETKQAISQDWTPPNRAILGSATGSSGRMRPDTDRTPSRHGAGGQLLSTPDDAADRDADASLLSPDRQRAEAAATAAEAARAVAEAEREIARREVGRLQTELAEAEAEAEAAAEAQVSGSPADGRLHSRADLAPAKELDMLQDELAEAEMASAAAKASVAVQQPTPEQPSESEQTQQRGWVAAAEIRAMSAAGGVVVLKGEADALAGGVGQAVPDVLRPLVTLVQQQQHEPEVQLEAAHEAVAKAVIEFDGLLSTDMSLELFDGVNELAADRLLPADRPCRWWGQLLHLGGGEVRLALSNKQPDSDAGIFII